VIPLGFAAAAVLVVATQNVQVGMPAYQARHDITRAAVGADVVVLQEMGGRRVAAGFTPAGFRCWQALSGPAREVPVCWRASRFAEIAAHTTLLHRSDLFPSATRAASTVVLRDRTTGRLWPVVDVHMIPHIEVGGRLRQLPRRALAVLALSRIDALADRLTARYGRVIIGGDFNIDATADHRVRQPACLWYRMNHGPTNYDTAWNTLPRTGPTLGRRRIDYVWWPKAAATAVRSATIGGTYSDHQLVRVTLAARR
jgi:endonuclease/exonuclease/phosphatase family metal-dependent hydrolase